MKICVYICLLISTIMFFGCVTYVNIPPQDGDIATHNPNDTVVREVLVESLRAIAKQYPFEGEFAILLPAETSSETYGKVATSTSENALWPGNKDRTDLPILDVRQIRIRGQQARVDVVRPLNSHDPVDLAEQVVTAELFWHPLQGWLIRRIRAWRLPVSDVLRLSVVSENGLVTE